MKLDTFFARAGAKRICAGLGGSFALRQWRWLRVTIGLAGGVVHAQSWQSLDIGTNTAGSTSASGETITISGSGTDIWNTADGFRYYYVPFSGDGTITARVISMTDTYGWSKAGVMVRESLTADARNVFVAITPEQHGVVAQYRANAGETTGQGAGPLVQPSYWLRLTRSGNTFTAFASADGTSWTQFANTTVAMSANAYVGLAVTSHADGTLCTVNFDNVALSGATTNPPSTGPTAPRLTEVTSSVGTGTVSSDGTSASVMLRRPQEYPTFSGTTDANAKVYLFFGSNPDSNTGALWDGNGVADATGRWTITPVGTQLSVGQTYAINLYAVDSAGHRSATTNVSLATSAPPGSPVVSLATVTGQVGVAITPVQVQATNSPTSFSADLYHYGLSISASGLISGTPNQALNGLSTTVYAMNDVGYGQNTVSLNIAPASGNPGTSWQSSDIGTSTAGATSDSGNGTVTLTGSGRDIWNTADGFRYYYQPVPNNSDCEIITRVASLQDTNGWAKAGVMLRDSLDPGSPQSMVCVSAEHGTAFQWRSSTGAESNTSTPTEDGGAPRWLKLVFNRNDYVSPHGATVSGYISSDGITWTFAGATIQPTARYIGLAVTSHADGTPCTAQFEQVQFITSPAAASNLHVTHRGAGEIDLAWTDNSTTETGFVIKMQAAYRNAPLLEVGRVGPNVTNFAVMGLGDALSALFSVQPVNDRVEGGAAITWAVTTITPHPVVFQVAASSVHLQWGDAGRQNYVDGYMAPSTGPFAVERSTDGTNFTEIAAGIVGRYDSSTTSVTDYTDTTVSPATTYWYRVRYKDAQGDVSGYGNTPAVTTSATSGASAPTIADQTVSGTAGTAMSYTISATNATSFSVSSGTLPAGLTLASSTGVISGTPTAAGTTTVTVQANNASGNATAQLTLNIAASDGGPTTGGWQSADIGTSTTGSTNATSATAVTLNGSGWDTWSFSDGFRFYYQPLNGDGTIIARVASVQNTYGWAKAGVMIRQSLAANAANVFVAVTPDHGVVTQYRANDNDGTGQLAGPTTTAPYWVKLVRTGNTFNAASSADGVNWTPFQSIVPSISIGTAAYVGLAVTSHADGTLCTAVFDNVSVAASSSPPPPPPPSTTWSYGDIGAVGIAGSNTSTGTTITVQGSGSDIWESADAFRFVWRTWTGDGVVDAQVSSMDNTHDWAKAGVMIRESNTPGSPNVFVALTPARGVQAQTRSIAGGSTAGTQGPLANAPLWVRIARSGNTFTAATSTDGMTWTPFATLNVPIASTADFGFAVTSHDNAQLNQAVFNNPFVGNH